MKKNNFMAFTLFIFGILQTFSLNAFALDEKQNQSNPKLVVTLVIDQFRADYLTRFRERFIPYKNNAGKIAGFEYLINEGSYFPFAKFDLLQAMTGPGHATILTGAYPYQMGIPVNDWYDKTTHDRMYCAEDQTQFTVGASPADKHIGTSPKNMLATTVGDELKNAGYDSKIISIAIKDRASIFMGGHRADLSLWLDKDSFQWVSSDYYLKDKKLPQWMNSLNESLQKLKGTNIEWKLPKENSGLSSDIPAFSDTDKYAKMLSKNFPHMAKADKGGLSLPFGLELTEKAAEAAVQAYNLGNNKSTDLLSISFSSHDYLGHSFGPNSRELEEMTVADDKIISTFLNFLNEKLPNGLKDVVIVLTGDHGIPPNPDWLKARNITAGRINSNALVNKMEEKLMQKFGRPIEFPYIAYTDSFNFFLDDRTLSAKKVKKADAEKIAKAAIQDTPGLAYVFTSSEYTEGKLPPGMHEREILKTYFMGRSGDIFAIPRPYFFEDYGTVSHMTGYNYDTMVPLIFTGPKIKKGKVFSNTPEMVDIAPSLSFMLGILPPNMSEGRVLSEMILE